MRRNALMKTVMIVYESKYGQTKKIAERVAELARARGYETRTVCVDAVDSVDAIGVAASIVLAPVFLEKHPKATREFVVRHLGALQSRPGAFFSVSGSAASKDPAARAAVRKIADDFLASVSWRPALVDTFGGAIAYPKYNVFVRFVMKRISKKNGGSTDTSKIHELTDWTAVEHATAAFMDIVEGKPRRAVA